jgi:hypothetical protein
VQTPSNEEKMTNLHERIVHMVRQLNIPVVEVSLVLSKYIRVLIEALQAKAIESNEGLPPRLMKSWPLEEEMQTQSKDFNFDLEKVLSLVDGDRMDILDTLIRTTINDEELALADSLLLMRQWEKDVRQRLSLVESPGQLFSPMEISEDH